MSSQISAKSFRTTPLKKVNGLKFLPCRENKLRRLLGTSVGDKIVELLDINNGACEIHKNNKLREITENRLIRYYYPGGQRRKLQSDSRNERWLSNSCHEHADKGKYSCCI